VKNTLVAVALVLAILVGLRAFTKAVGKPVERSRLAIAKEADLADLRSCALKLLNGCSLEQVSAEILQRSASGGGHAGAPAPQPSLTRAPQKFPQRAWPAVKALHSESRLRLKGLVLGPRPLIIVNHATLAPGEEVRIPLETRTVIVRSLEVTAQSARVLVNGTPTTLYLSSEHGSPP